MKIVKIDLQNPDQKLIDEAVQFLNAGKIVIHPTETCYGLAVDIFQHSALKILYTLKGMPETKPVSIMVRDFAEAQKYAEFNDQAIKIAKKFWPGPVTLVLPRKACLVGKSGLSEQPGQFGLSGQANLPGHMCLPSFLNFGCETVGVRCPDSKISRMLIEGVGHPLSTTSANVSGQPETYNVQDFLAQVSAQELKNGLKQVLVLDAGELPRNPPSILVGFENGKIKVLREGVLYKNIMQ